MSQQPNLLVIVSEDHSQHLGCYGAKDAKTPHLDALAARGVRFHNHHTTQAVCSPGRASILTGKYPHENGQIGLASQNYGMYKPYANMASILKKAGYRTGRVGKLHVNPEDAFPFDFVWGDKNHFGFQVRENEVANEQAANFMADGDEPFFMYIAYPDAHLPLLRQSGGEPKHPQTGDDISPMPEIGIDSPRYREVLADYYNCMNRLDTGVGSLLQHLEDMGKADNTVVIFTTDHGQHLPRGKYHINEPSLRLPWIMHHPTLLPKGGRINLTLRVLTSHVDILPTVLYVLNIDDLPEDLHGSSAVPLVRGEDDTWRDYVVGEWNSGSGTLLYPQRSIRVGRYKYIISYFAGRPNPNGELYFDAPSWGNIVIQQDELEAAPAHVQAAYERSINPPREQLYDLENDPHEFEDLADNPEYADTLARLRKRLEDWQRETKDYIADPEVLARLDANHKQIIETYFKSKTGGLISKDFEYDYYEYLCPR